MSVVATQSVHALLRDLVANSPRRHFLDDTEGIETSNQAALARDVVETVHACLEPAIDCLRASERDAHDTDPTWAAGPGPRALMAIAHYEEILGALRDTAWAMDAGRTSTAWTLLGAAGERLRVLAALASPTGADIARDLTVSSAYARARYTAVSAADGDGLTLPAFAESTKIPAAESVSTGLPDPDRTVAGLLETIELGAETGRDGGPLSTLLRPARREDYAHLAAVGGHQARLLLEVVRCATDVLCGFAATTAPASEWGTWADDVREAVDFAGDCL